MREGTARRNGRRAQAALVVSAAAAAAVFSSFGSGFVFYLIALDDPTLREGERVDS